MRAHKLASQTATPYEQDGEESQLCMEHSPNLGESAVQLIVDVRNDFERIRHTDALAAATAHHFPLRLAYL
eukprot:6460469-Amphidinium_carterae.2